jgi:DNA-binding transcriptional ArsR family regulator
MSSRSDEQALAEPAVGPAQAADTAAVDAAASDTAARVIDSGKVAMICAAMPPSAQVADLADVFGLLADPGRLRVLVALLEGEMCVSDLAAVGQVSESAVSHHLRLLRAHRVVGVRRSGRMAYYRLADGHVRMLLDVALTHIGHAPAADHPEHGARAEDQW